MFIRGHSHKCITCRNKGRDPHDTVNGKGICTTCLNERQGRSSVATLRLYSPPKPIGRVDGRLT